ncbi:MAG: hypothetical protein ACLFPO_03630, partial [Spirochaetaceae bacterium]
LSEIIRGRRRITAATALRLGKCFGVSYYNSRWTDIIWDQEKNSRLKERRGIAFEEIEGMLLEGGYLDIIDTPVREGQQCFIMSIHDYTWVVPFVVSDGERVVLKTAFRSRNYRKIYGGSQ